jgi:hypothetical protein
MFQDNAERLVVFIVVRVNVKDGTLGDGELGLEGAFEEGGPHAQDGSVSIDLMVTAFQNDVGVFRVVVYG